MKPLLVLMIAVLAVLGLAGSALGARLDVADRGGRPFTVDMTGAEEAPGPGDPDGSGVARLTVNPGHGEVCWELTVEDIETATAAHIHEAPAGEPGPVVVPLSAPADGFSTGCIQVDRELARDIIRSPEQYYVNVHNEPFPAGAVRGQLSRSGV